MKATRRTVRYALGLLRAVTTVVITLACIAVLARIYLERVWSAEERVGLVVTDTDTEQAFWTAQQLERIESAVEVFRVRRGRLPADLDELTQEGLLAPRDLRFPRYAEPYYYRRHESAYVLYPPRL